MPIDLRFKEPSTFIVRGSGDVTVADVAAVLDELLSHSSLAPGSCVLADARKVRSVPPTAELRRIAKDLTPLRAHGVARIAVVARSNFVYGIARMFMVFAEGIGLNISVFRRVRDATEWLSSVDAAA